MKRVSLRLMMFLVTLAAAFFLEQALSAAADSAVPLPPLVLFSALVWLTAFPLSGRLWLSAGVGYAMDLYGDAPFGAAVLLMTGAAFLSEFLWSVVWVRAAPAGRAAVGLVLTAAVLLLHPLARIAAARLAVPFL